jgi:hypothetical protein
MTFFGCALEKGLRAVPRNIAGAVEERTEGRRRDAPGRDEKHNIVQDDNHGQPKSLCVPAAELVFSYLRVYSNLKIEIFFFALVEKGVRAVPRNIA